MNKIRIGGIYMKEEKKRILISLISLVTGIFIISFAVGFFSVEPERVVETSEVEVKNIPKPTKSPEATSEPECDSDSSSDC